MKGEGVDFYCWHCLHNCLGGQFCGTLLPLYSVFGHFTGPPEWPPINQLRQWWFPALKSQLNSYETPLFKEQTLSLRKGEEKEENRYKGRQSLGRSVKKDCKKRLQGHQKLSTTPKILQYVGNPFDNLRAFLTRLSNTYKRELKRTFVLLSHHYLKKTYC